FDEYTVAGMFVSVCPRVLKVSGSGVGGATLLGYMENGYVLGMGQQWIHITMFISVNFVALFLVKRIRALGEKYDMVTISDYTTLDRKSTRLNSSHVSISYAVFCLKKSKI